MKKIWNTISDVGIHPELNHEEARRIRLLNRLNFISFVTLLIYIFIEWAIGVYMFIPGLIGMCGLVFITSVFLYNRKYKLAKNFAVLVIASCISFFTLNTGEAFSEALFIPLSVMPLIVFKNKKVALFYLFFLATLTVILKLLQPHVDPMLHLEGQQLLFFRILNLLNGIIITFFITWYFKGANESFESKLIHMNELISEKNKEITDSINYAKHIQNAILPSKEFFSQIFPGSFIYFKPKDIVAGDFYWMYVSQESGKGEGEQIFFAAADCTGHGVPGALVSVICSNALNRAVKEFNISDPGKILDKTRALVIETFNKSKDEVKDGMDISLACLNKKTNELFWSGANNPLWLIQKSELIEFKPDKQPVGQSDLVKPFTTHRIQLSKNDSIYLFTDGFADQFGGEKGKKFKYSQFKNLLLNSYQLSPEVQEERIDKELENWMGPLEQVDDILIIGIRI